MALIIGSLVIGVTAKSFASDWDKAGKILTIIEGVRVVTGGKVDLIGSITGINRPGEESREFRYAREYNRPPYYSQENRRDFYQYERCVRVWVPHYVWRERYVPRHTEYRPGYGEVVVEGHYERYQVEEGGHWERVYR
jgi:hypothetical protein